MRRPESVANFLESARGSLSDDRLLRINRYTRQLFERALTSNDDGTVFVVTGDIPAMWIRDSTWQVRPLLRMNPDEELLGVIAGVSRMQSQQLLIDPYANAFNPTASGECWHKDFPDQSPWVFERKFEIDSLAAFFELALALHSIDTYSRHLDETFWLATEKVLDVVEREMAHEPASYKFVRPGAPEPDHLTHGGFGAPFDNIGLMWSGFRPSDDRCVYPFNIPGNAHLSVVLQKLAQVAEAQGHPKTAERAKHLGARITAALNSVIGSVDVIPYEVDGMGSALLEDDPNFPSLLSLPFLGWCSADDQQYMATRKWLLSKQHRLWCSGEFGEGLMSDHTPDKHIWPLAIAMRGLTASDMAEKNLCLEMLENSDGGTGSMHESFHVDDAKVFTRPWFSWADMAYCDLALDVAGIASLAR